MTNILKFLKEKLLQLDQEAIQFEVTNENYLPVNEADVHDGKILIVEEMIKELEDLHVNQDDIVMHAVACGLAQKGKIPYTSITYFPLSEKTMVLREELHWEFLPEPLSNEAKHENRYFVGV